MQFKVCVGLLVVDGLGAITVALVAFFASVWRVRRLYL